MAHSAAQWLLALLLGSLRALAADSAGSAGEGGGVGCHDTVAGCSDMALRGACVIDEGIMREQCMATCGFCASGTLQPGPSAAALLPRPPPLPRALAALVSPQPARSPVPEPQPTSMAAGLIPGVYGLYGSYGTSGCSDTSPECASLELRGGCVLDEEAMRPICAATCGYCQGGANSGSSTGGPVSPHPSPSPAPSPPLPPPPSSPPPSPPPSPSPPPPAGNNSSDSSNSTTAGRASAAVCRDSAPDCAALELGGECVLNKDDMYAKCASTCGFCEGCDDHNARCPVFATGGVCSTDKGLDLCARSCGRCWQQQQQVASPALLPSPPSSIGMSGAADNDQNWGSPTASPSNPRVCRDYVEGCYDLSRVGECVLNDEDMRAKCAATCGFCAGCSDRNTDCPQWAAAGACSSESAFDICARSCGRCGRIVAPPPPPSPPALPPLPPSVPSPPPSPSPPGVPLLPPSPPMPFPPLPPGLRLCRDTTSDCWERAGRGECILNEAVIAGQCASTCGFCGGCADSLTGCPEWAANGACTAERVKDACARSCGMCKRLSPPPPSPSPNPPLPPPPSPPLPLPPSPQDMSCAYSSNTTSWCRGDESQLLYRVKCNDGDDAYDLACQLTDSTGYRGTLLSTDGCIDGNWRVNPASCPAAFNVSCPYVHGYSSTPNQVNYLSYYTDGTVFSHDIVKAPHVFNGLQDLVDQMADWCDHDQDCDGFDTRGKFTTQGILSSSMLGFCFYRRNPPEGYWGSF